MDEQRVRRDVERHAEEDVGRALIELARQAPPGRAGRERRDVELEERVTGRQRHVGQVGDVPRRHDQATRVGVGLDVADELGDLVDMFARRRQPRAPLIAVDGSELAVRVGPLVPDGHAVFFEIGDVRRARQEPQQLVEDRLRVQLLRRQQRKAGREVEAHLVAEHRQRAGAGAIGLLDAVLEHVAHEVEVGAHVSTRRSGSRAPRRSPMLRRRRS